MFLESCFVSFIVRSPSSSYISNGNGTLPIFSVVCCIYFTFLAKTIIPITVSFIIFTSLYTYVTIYVVARKKMLKRNEIHSNSNQETSRNLLAFLRELKMEKFTYWSFLYASFVTCQPLLSLELRILCILMRRHLTVWYNATNWTTILTSMNSTLNCVVFFLGKQRNEKRR